MYFMFLKINSIFFINKLGYVKKNSALCEVRIKRLLII
jgi:hypothetical protein